VTLSFSRRTLPYVIGIIINLGVDCRIILEWSLDKYGGKVWIGFIWLRIETVAGSCEHDNEPSGSVRGGVLLEKLSHC
jgi:hypothetical protein